MATDRRLDVLRAIVEDYVQTREPVGSRSLVERHDLQVSPATVRNDMVMLEERGYIAQPHTSAGRIPTDKGYRLFVGQLQTIKPMSAAERRAIERFLESAVDLDDVVHRTVRLLSQLTGNVAVMQYPSLRRSVVRHVELVELDPSRVMVIVITDTGRVEQRVVDACEGLDSDVLAELRTRINQCVVGQNLADWETVTEPVIASVKPEHREPVQRIVNVVAQTLTMDREERIMMGGTANLTRVRTDFASSIGLVLEALEEHVVLLKLLSSVDEETSGEANDVKVVIGRENDFAGLAETSVVTTGYGRNEVARLGVLGPLRMDYPSTIAAVRAVANYVSTILGE